MPEFRFDPLRHCWVSFAPERHQRPRDFAEDGAHVTSSIACDCLFCKGQEHRTPTATFTVPNDLPNESTGEPLSVADDWRVRIVPNSYPAAATHEVIIESPEHQTQMSGLDAAQFGRVVQAYWGRLSQLRQAAHIEHVSLWKNSGPAAGASLSHVHSQLMGTPFVSRAVQQELDLARQRCRDSQACPWCELLSTEQRAACRIVLETEYFVAFCPFASRFVAETWIVPRRHAAHFDSLTLSERTDFATSLRSCFTALETAFPNTAYNAALHTAPFRLPDVDAFHWHFEIMPRVNGLAGFELGSENYINTVLPEEAAAQLRAALLAVEKAG